MEQVKSINFASIYVDDYEKALKFYNKHFGYEVKYPMGANSSWGKANDAALFIEGGYEKSNLNDKSVRSSVVFNVASASKFYTQLKADGITLLQSEPVHMGADDYWFQFKDPAGNILEILGSV